MFTSTMARLHTILSDEDEPNSPLQDEKHERSDKHKKKTRRSGKKMGRRRAILTSANWHLDLAKVTASQHGPGEIRSVLFWDRVSGSVDNGPFQRLNSAAPSSCHILGQHCPHLSQIFFFFFFFGIHFCPLGYLNPM